MNTKIWMIIGTMAIAITWSGSSWKEETAEAAPSLTAGGVEWIRPDTGTEDTADSGAEASEAAEAVDPYYAALGVSSGDELYDALYDGQSLADIAAGHGQDPERIIRLQLAELSEQLDARLLSGSLSPEAYLSHKAELAEIITKSAYGTA